MATLALPDSDEDIEEETPWATLEPEATGKSPIPLYQPIHEIGRTDPERQEKENVSRTELGAECMGVSRSHCQLEKRDNGVWLVNLGTTNPTFVNLSSNKTKLHKDVREVLLSAGDVITLDWRPEFMEQTSFKVRLHDPVSSPGDSRAAPSGTAAQLSPSAPQVTPRAELQETAAEVSPSAPPQSEGGASASPRASNFTQPKSKDDVASRPARPATASQSATAQASASASTLAPLKPQDDDKQLRSEGGTVKTTSPGLQLTPTKRKHCAEDGAGSTKLSKTDSERLGEAVAQKHSSTSTLTPSQSQEDHDPVRLEEKVDPAFSSEAKLTPSKREVDGTSQDSASKKSKTDSGQKKQRWPPGRKLEAMIEAPDIVVGNGVFVYKRGEKIYARINLKKEGVSKDGISQHYLVAKASGTLIRQKVLKVNDFIKELEVVLIDKSKLPDMAKPPVSALYYKRSDDDYVAFEKLWDFSGAKRRSTATGPGIERQDRDADNGDSASSSANPPAAPPGAAVVAAAVEVAVPVADTCGNGGASEMPGDQPVQDRTPAKPKSTEPVSALSSEKRKKPEAYHMRLAQFLEDGRVEVRKRAMVYKCKQMESVIDIEKIGDSQYMLVSEEFEPELRYGVPKFLDFVKDLETRLLQADKIAEKPKSNRGSVRRVHVCSGAETVCFLLLQGVSKEAMTESGPGGSRPQERSKEEAAEEMQQVMSIDKGASCDDSDAGSADSEDGDGQTATRGQRRADEKDAAQGWFDVKPDDLKIHTNGVGLGEGSLGKIYRGTLTNPDGTKVDVAVKSFSAKNAQAAVYKRELEFLQLGNRIQGMCRLRGSTLKDGQFHILMKQYDGDLAQELNDGPLKPGKCLEVLRQVCSALAELHAHKVHIADLKPSNILHDERERYVIADFGISQTVDKTQGNVPTLQRSEGTIFYMAPEQHNCVGVGLKSDMWSLACTMVHMLSGKVPWYKLNRQEIVNRVCDKKEHPDIPLHLRSPKVIEALQRCFTWSRDERISAKELLDIVNDALGGITGSSARKQKTCVLLFTCMTEGSGLRVDNEGNHITSTFWPDSRYMPKPTKKQLFQCLCNVAPIDAHVLHLAGHGDVNKGYVLHPETGGGQFSEQFQSNSLVDLVNKHTSIECVFLNACDTVKSGREFLEGSDSNPFGVQVVICWDGAVDDDVALLFSETFYTQLKNDESRLYGECFQKACLLMNEKKAELERGRPDHLVKACPCILWSKKAKLKVRTLESQGKAFGKNNSKMYMHLSKPPDPPEKEAASGGASAVWSLVSGVTSWLGWGGHTTLEDSAGAGVRNWRPVGLFYDSKAMRVFSKQRPEYDFSALAGSEEQQCLIKMKMCTMMYKGVKIGERCSAWKEGPWNGLDVRGFLGPKVLKAIVPGAKCTYCKLWGKAGFVANEAANKSEVQLKAGIEHLERAITYRERDMRRCQNPQRRREKQEELCFPICRLPKASAKACKKCYWKHPNVVSVCSDSTCTECNHLDQLENVRQTLEKLLEAQKELSDDTQRIINDFKKVELNPK